MPLFDVNDVFSSVSSQQISTSNDENPSKFFMNLVYSDAAPKMMKAKLTSSFFAFATTRGNDVGLGSSSSSSSIFYSRAAKPPYPLDRLVLQDRYRFLPDRRRLFSTFHPANLAFITIKNALLILNPNLIRVQYKLNELEQAERVKDAGDDEDEIDFEKFFAWKHRDDEEVNLWNGFVGGMKYGVFRDVVVMQLTRVFEYMLFYWDGLVGMTYKKAKRLVRDIPSYASRKYKKFYGLYPYERYKKGKYLFQDNGRINVSTSAELGKYAYWTREYIESIFYETLHAQILFHAAVFTFSITQEAYFILKNNFNIRKGDFVFVDGLSRGEKLSKLMKEVVVSLKDKDVQISLGVVVGKNLVYTTQAWIFSAVGAVAGSLAYPGLGTVVGLNLMPVVGPLAVQQIASLASHPRKNNS